MTAANAPQAPATRRSRRRCCGWWLAGFMALFSTSSSPAPSHGRIARHAGQSALDQEHGKEHEQIEERVGEQAARRARRALTHADAAHAPGECDHDGTGDDRGYAIDR